MTLGGIRRIAAVAQFLVPFMAIGYVLSCLVIVGLNLEKLTETLVLIINSAFTGTAARAVFLEQVWRLRSEGNCQENFLK